VREMGIRRERISFRPLSISGHAANVKLGCPSCSRWTPAHGHTRVILLAWAGDIHQA
jgi:hypothetical protein